MKRGALEAVMVGTAPPEYVKRLAATGFGVTADELEGHSRKHPLVFYRQAAMAATRIICGTSYPAIGRVYDRDHTTVMHAVRWVKAGKNHPVGSHRRRLWEATDTLCDEVQRQWAIDTGQPVPMTGQLPLTDAQPVVVFA